MSELHSSILMKPYSSSLGSNRFSALAVRRTRLLSFDPSRVVVVRDLSV